MRKTTILLIIAFALLSCKNKNAKHISKETEEINKVVEAVIECDSLGVLKQTMFCTELKRITIEIDTKGKDGLIPPASPGNSYISSLLHEKVNGEIFFSSKDSSAIIAQNSNPKRLKLDEEITDKLRTTTFQEEMSKLEKRQEYNFCEMSIPIFSLDKQKAYLTLDHYCGGLCGSGMVIYLKKVNGVWKIVDKRRTWVS